MASDRILELLRRPVDVDEYAEIRELWKTHSIAEDNRDLPGLISTLTEDCVYEVMGTGARWEGHEGAARFYTELLTAFPDIHFDLEYIVIGPQGVCEEARVTATHQARWLEHEPTGERLEWRNAIFFPWDPAARRSSRARWSTPTCAARNPLARTPSADPDGVGRRLAAPLGASSPQRLTRGASGGMISAGRRRATDRNASTTAGLNCLPRPAWIWSIASSTSSATAYGRSVVIASQASAIAMIAASTGMSVPLSRSGIPEPVPALVVVADRRHRVSERRDPRDDLRAAGHVLAHDRGLRAVEPLGLREDRVGHPDLADVVEERRRREGAELSRGEAELASDRERDAANALRVARGIRIARLDRGVERLDRLEQRRLELARRLDEVVRARLEILVLRAHPWRKRRARAARGRARARRRRSRPRTRPFRARRR